MNNSNLALFAGLIASDGHLDRNYHGIRLITSNKEFLETRILKLFKFSSYKIWKTRSGFGKERYILYLYDKKLKHLLENRYGIPRGKKSENINARVDQLFKSVDANGDGRISKEETEQKAPAITENFNQIDANHDGALNKKEFKAFWAVADKKRREFN